MSKIGLLTVQKAYHLGAYVGMTKGNALAHRFCDAVEAGEVPDQEDLATVAHALSLLRFGNADAAKLAEMSARLGAKKKQGKELADPQKSRRHGESVMEFLRIAKKFQSQGMDERQAEKQARKIMCEKLCIGDPAFRARIRRYRESAEGNIQVLDAIDRRARKKSRKSNL